MICKKNLVLKLISCQEKSNAQSSRASPLPRHISCHLRPRPRSNSAAHSSLLLRTGAAEPRRHHQHHNSDLFSTKFTILLLPKHWAANTCVYCETKPNLVILFFFFFFRLSRRRRKLLLLFWRRAAGLEGHLTRGARPSSAPCSRVLPTSPSHVLQPPACSEPLLQSPAGAPHW